jgi:hypothetical protein
MNSISDANRRPVRTRRRRLGALAAVGLALFAPAALAADPAIPAGADFASWADNGRDGQIVLRLVNGDAPAPGVSLSGVVKSDTNCAPDAQGVSYCQNVIALADGATIAATHAHAMSRYGCLWPGQRLSIARLDGDWLVATQVK